jgi:hypothetical protein
VFQQKADEMTPLGQGKILYLLNMLFVAGRKNTATPLGQGKILYLLNKYVLPTFCYQGKSYKL